jgi:hypothetical protein
LSALASNPHGIAALIPTTFPIECDNCQEATMSELGDVVRVLRRGDPLAPASAGEPLPDLAVWETVPFVAPDACAHESTMCAECRRTGWPDYYVEGL